MNIYSTYNKSSWFWELLPSHQSQRISKPSLVTELQIDIIVAMWLHYNTRHWSESVLPRWQFHPLATTTGKVSDTEVTDRILDWYGQIFKGSVSHSLLWKKSGGYLDRRKRSQYTYSSTRTNLMLDYVKIIYNPPSLTCVSFKIQMITFHHSHKQCINCIFYQSLSTTSFKLFFGMHKYLALSTKHTLGFV